MFYTQFLGDKFDASVESGGCQSNPVCVDPDRGLIRILKWKCVGELWVYRGCENQTFKWDEDVAVPH